MKISELREMSDEQLAITLRETISQLFKLRVQAATERVDAPNMLRLYRRTIARIKTLQRERVLAAAPSVADSDVTASA
ncbi:MAG: 50S ribosomal protein L29 [Pirellulaceae bacterium]|nr:50S ribosomal protein L29 [Pirellulaceae bacterium]